MNTTLTGVLLPLNSLKEKKDFSTCSKLCAAELCLGFTYDTHEKSCAIFASIRGKIEKKGFVSYILEMPTDDENASRKCIQDNFSGYGSWKHQIILKNLL